MDNFWIHCNLCSSQFTEAKIKFYLLSCQHVLCKNCMKVTQNGKVCPICKKNIKYIEFGKLTDVQKKYFHPNVTSALHEPLKMIQFQQNHQAHMFKLTLSYKEKYYKAIQTKSKLRDSLSKKLENLKKMEMRRKQMQQKLKQIYLKQEQEKYRQKSSVCSSTNANSSRTFGTPTPSSAARIIQKNTGDFFDFNSPSFKGSSCNNSEFSIGSSHMKSSSASRSTQRSQHHRLPDSQRRSPFFT